VNYLFDSNLCIAIMNGTARRVTDALDSAIQAGAEFFVPSIVVHELWFGVAKSQEVAANAQKLSSFLGTQVETLALNDTDAKAAGEIRAELARRGTPIGPYDVLIAGQTLARQMTLVTANTREFSRVDGLKLVDWTI
jgi:tRNA(fMet)-specific endonuclease VapC